MAHERLISLDVLRGITIAGMIIVNCPGSWQHIFTPLSHSVWNGLTPCDLVFPFFLFITGVSTYISLRKFNGRWSPALAGKVVKRTCLLFLIGLLLNGCAQGCGPLSHLRIMGVLQRLALCYLFTVVAGMALPVKRIPLLVVLLLGGYYILLVAGNGFDYGPDNILSVIDRSVLGEARIYNDRGIEPEGLLSTIPSVAHALTGYCIGYLCLQKTDIHAKVEKLLLVGTVLLFVGYLLSYGCPVNKKIWSPTYVLMTCGGAIQLLALLIELIDVRKQKLFTQPFVVLGRNPLCCYIFSELFFVFLVRFTVNGESLHTLYYNKVLAAAFGDNSFSSLLMAISVLAVTNALGYFLNKKKIYIKL